jgi:nucleoside-diphosphate-sugar epimerase
MRFGKVLMTGAGGLLGGYVARELAGKAQISGLDIASPLGAEGIGTFTRGSIEDPAAVTAAMKGQDAVVHIAARPNIWSGQGHEIMHTNVTGTWNVLQAAEEAGVKRVILTSSDSVIGFTVLQGSMLPPDYLPVDETHPRRPTDAYAISKKLCEELGRSFAERGKLEVVVLRPVYVLYPEFEGEVRARAANPTTYTGPAAGGRQPAGGGVMWHYVDPRDLARAYRLALAADKPAFGPYFICARTTLAPEPTIERLAARMGRRIPVKRPQVYEQSPHAPLYDLTFAEQQLGFVAQHDMRSLLYPET